MFYDVKCNKYYVCSGFVRKGVRQLPSLSWTRVLEWIYIIQHFVKDPALPARLALSACLWIFCFNMRYNLLESTSCQHICRPAALVIKGILPVHSVGRSGRMQKGGLDLSLIFHDSTGFADYSSIWDWESSWKFVQASCKTSRRFLSGWALQGLRHVPAWQQPSTGKVHRSLHFRPWGYGRIF